jgi:hypothetical protein
MRQRSTDKKTLPVTVTACPRYARSCRRNLLAKLKAVQNGLLGLVRTVPPPRDRLERFSG